MYTYTPYFFALGLCPRDACERVRLKISPTQTMKVFSLHQPHPFRVTIALRRAGCDDAPVQGARPRLSGAIALTAIVLSCRIESLDY